jgi:hypothetical protein
MTYHYLASPYTHPEHEVMERRYDAALHALNFLLRRKLWTYSPIVHCHALSKSYDLPRTHDFWQAYNHAMLDTAKGLIILAIEGWNESRGIEDELTTARKLLLPVSFLHPNPNDTTVSSDDYFVRSA